MHEETMKKSGTEEITFAEKRNALGPGRIGVYTALGAVTGVVPLPWVPDSIARRIRGALAQDVAARHGLSLTSEARAVFAEPEPIPGARGMMGQAVRFVTTKLLARFTPLGFLLPLRTATQVFALGHLLHRYLEMKRDDGSIRIDAEEARRVRLAIDESLISAWRTELPVEPAPRFAAPEDLRDSTTQLLDGLIIGAAGMPDWIVRRLNAAFDERIGGA